MRTRLVLAAFLVVGLMAACGRTAPVRHVSSGTIVFTSSLSGSEGIYAVRPDGTGLSRLLSFPHWGAQVLWNSEGTRALVLPEYGKQFPAYVLDWPSRKRHSVQFKGFDPSSYAAWSPDGKKLLLSGDSVASYDVATHRLTTVPGLTWEDAFSWAGDSKAVLHFGGDPRTIVRSSITGTTDAVVYTGDANAGFPQSSVDGRWYSFDDFGGMSDRYYVIRRSGRDKRLIATDAGGVSAAWSSRGDRLAYTTSKGTGVLDLASGKRTFVAAPSNDPSNNPPGWSPDGTWVLFWRFDLGYGAPSDSHLQLWAMHSDGTAAHAVTHALTPDWGNGTETWVAATLHGTPLPRVPLIAVPGSVHTTDLPVVALAARGARAVVATGFGSISGGPRYPLGPIVSLGAGGKASSHRVHGCHSFGAVFLTDRQTGYVCTNNAVGYGYDDAVRLGARTLAHPQGGEFTGTYLAGVATDGRTVAFGIEHTPPPAQINGNFEIRDTWIYESRGAGRRLVATLPGAATVESIDGDRIAVLHGRHTVSVLSPGATKSYALDGPPVVGAALDGGRVVVLENGRFVTLDLATGRKTYQRTELGLDIGSGSALEDVHGDLVAYVTGAGVHVMRLTDGREVVLDIADATDPVLAAFGSGGLFYAYNEAYAKQPGRIGFVSFAELEHAISAKGRPAR